MTLEMEDFATPTEKNLERFVSPARTKHSISGDLEESGHQWDKEEVAEMLVKYPGGNLPDDHYLAKYVEPDVRPHAGPETSLMGALKNWRNSLVPLKQDLDSRRFVESNSSSPEDRVVDPVHEFAMRHRDIHPIKGKNSGGEGFPENASMNTAEPKGTGAVKGDLSQIAAMPAPKTR